MLSTIHPDVSIRALTHSDGESQGQGRFHFFGYYDKSPWDAAGRYILGMEVPFMDRPPGPEDVAVIGMTDLRRGGAWTPLAETRAWNWQQGSMLQWLGTSSQIIFNDRRDDRFIARILDVHTGAERILDRPVYAVNRPGTAAVSINFARLHHQRPGYGYAGVVDAWRTDLEPRDDGLFAVDIATGGSRLILSTAEAAQFQRRDAFNGRLHRFNHVQFGGDPNRFAFLHRHKNPAEGPNGVGHTRLLTINLDGSGLYCLNDCDFVSHYDWLGGDSILAWAKQHGHGDHYYLYRDQTPHWECIGHDTFQTDGHCSFSPDHQWMLTDTYPDKENYRTLMLYHMASGERIDIGRFLSPPTVLEIRCDLHPRWNRDGTQVCIDSLHEGGRQMYVLDVHAITGRKTSASATVAAATAEQILEPATASV